MRPAAAFAAGVLAGVLVMLAVTGTDGQAPRPTVHAPLAIGAGSGRGSDRAQWTPVPAIPAGPMGVSEPDLAPDSASLPAVVAPSPRATPTVGRTTPMRSLPTAAPARTPRPATRPGSGRSGWATYFAAPGGTAAAGPALRRLLGKAWRGSLVDICAASGCVQVRLTDFCACGPRKGRPTLVDLAASDFADLAPLGLGVLDVTVSRA